MTLFERARYAAYLAIVASACLSLILALGSADAIGLLPASAFDLALSPKLVLGVYAVAYIVAPWAAGRVPIYGDRSTENREPPRSSSYPVRIAALALGGVVVALAANLLVFLLGKVT